MIIAIASYTFNCNRYTILAICSGVVYYSISNIYRPKLSQRCAAAKNPQTAKNGILISIVFWLIFDFLTLTNGLYSAAYLHLPSPLDAYPILADTVMPQYVERIAISCDNCNSNEHLESYSFISAATFGNDIFPQFLKNCLLN
jgi:SSS family solute:Na+ symporter